jgi:hypothetical protein
MYVQDSAVPDGVDVVNVSDDPGERTDRDLPDDWDDSARWKVSRVARARRLPVALGRLWRGRSRLRHLPTLRQVRWMAGFDGREPCSYLLDRSVNYIPEMLPDPMVRQLGRHGLRLTGMALGETFETVVFPDGWGFDLN